MLESELFRVRTSGLVTLASRFTISAALSRKIDPLGPLSFEASLDYFDALRSLDSRAVLFLAPDALRSTSGSSLRPSIDLFSYDSLPLGSSSYMTLGEKKGLISGLYPTFMLY